MKKLHKYFENEELLGKIKEGKPLKYGVILARFQPIHKAHIYMINKALSECDALLILVGSSNKSGSLRNPFNIETRFDMLDLALDDTIAKDRIAIDALPDWASESSTKTFCIWGHYLYYSIVSRIGTKRFTMYYSDEPEKILCWFDDEVISSIDFCFSKRDDILEGVSSTKIREALELKRAEDIDYLQKLLPIKVFEKAEFLSGIWKKVLQEPKEERLMS